MINFLLAVAINTTTTHQEKNIFLRFWHNIHWDELLSVTIQKILLLILYSLIFYFIKKFGVYLIERSFKKYRQKEILAESRIATLHALTRNIFFYTLFFFYLYTFLSVLGVPVGSLLAGAGIAGLAIGLGAQGFINDIVTGFFIILEQQLDVGDHVKIAGIDGNVVSVGLRTTQIKSPDGIVHFIPNRNITIVSNLSRDNMRALIDLRIFPNSDIARIEQIIQQVNEKLLPKYPSIQSGPDILGAVDDGFGNLSLRIVIYTLNGEQYQVQRDFLSAYLETLAKEKIDLPASPLQLENYLQSKNQQQTNKS